MHKNYEIQKVMKLAFNKKRIMTYSLNFYHAHFQDPLKKDSSILTKQIAIEGINSKLREQ